MKKSAYIPSRSEISKDTPLRLDVAAALAYPDGSMTASGLRREAARGRLVTERVAGKDYTTLANIERMRELCRAGGEDRDSGSSRPGETGRGTLMPAAGRSGTDESNAALVSARTRIRALSMTPSLTTSTPSERPPATVTAIRAKS
jgi:hypothetical protein